MPDCPIPLEEVRNAYTLLAQALPYVKHGPDFRTAYDHELGIGDRRPVLADAIHQALLQYAEPE